MNLIGAIVFGDDSTILAIIPPAPTPEILHQNLARVHKMIPRARLCLKGITKAEFKTALEAYCYKGTPLPNIFDPQIALAIGFTQFQQDCYRQAALIPHGETRSYSWLATRLKRGRSERAVGGAMKSNPFPLIIPCHRVIKKDGRLGGFLGVSDGDSWELQLKRFLLEIEEQHLQPSLFMSLQAGHLLRI